MLSAPVAPVSAPLSVSFAVLLAALALPVGAQDDAKVDFVKQIKPILEQRCFNCHGGKRTEGELNMTSRASVFHDDKEMWAIVPGDHEFSPVYERIILPAGDPDLMPEDGPPLGAVEIAVIKRWITEGAPWPEGVVLEGEAPAPVDVVEVPEMDETTALSVTATLEALRGHGAVAQRVAMDTQAVDVNLSILGDKATDDMVRTLRALGPALVWLNLSRSAVTDAGMATVAGMPHLRRLHLAQTGVGDAGVVHIAKLTDLQYLNLYGTKVTDAGLQQLTGLVNLRKLYLWQTEVTDEGVAALREALPNLKVDRGDFLPQPPEPAPTPVNDKCPVSGEAVDANFTVLHEGRWIGFCCAKCRGSFEKDPKKFSDKIVERASEKAGDKAGAAQLNSVCPVTAQPVDKGIVVAHEGLQIAFCCEKCKAKFVAAPAKYLEGLEHPGKTNK